MTEILLFQRLMTWIRPYRAMLAFAVISLITIALTTSLSPLLIKQLLDSIALSKNELEGFQFILLTVVGLLTLRGIAILASSYAVNWISGKIGTDLKMVLFEKLLALPASCPEKPDPDKLVAYFASNIDRATDDIAQILTVLGKELSTVIGLLVVMLFLNWEFSVMGLSVALVIGSIMQFISQASDPDQKTPPRLMNIPFLFLTSSEHIKTVKLNESQSQECQHFRDSIEHLRSLILKRIIIKTFGKIIALIIATAILAAFFLLFMQQLYLNKITIGDAGALTAAGLMFIFPLRQLLRIQPSLQNKLRVLQHIDSLLAQQNESDSGHVRISRARGQIRFEEVSIHHPSQNCLLPNLTLILHPGEIIGLASSSDSREKILIDLIARFIYPTNGKILLDGVDIATLKLADLRANIAWVIPTTELLDDTIAANIAYGTTRCETEAHIMKVARTCHVTKFAREMPHGLQTRIDNKNVELMANQRQCILIARALLKNPAIVIIDETSTLFDTDCTLVNDALDALIHNRTTLIISSRPAMLEKAYRIITLT